MIQLRQGLGLSQRALARTVGYKAGVSILLIERGRSSPPMKKAVAIANALGVPVQEVFPELLQEVPPDGKAS
jgi:DNA-binding XRE family transcriptional regulator